MAFQKELSTYNNLTKLVRSVHVLVHCCHGQNEMLKAILAVWLIHNIVNCIIKLFLLVHFNAKTQLVAVLPQREERNVSQRRKEENRQKPTVFQN